MGLFSSIASVFGGGGNSSSSSSNSTTVETKNTTSVTVNPSTTVEVANLVDLAPIQNLTTALSGVSENIAVSMSEALSRVSENSAKMVSQTTAAQQGSQTQVDALVSSFTTFLKEQNQSDLIIAVLTIGASIYLAQAKGDIKL